MKSKYEIRMTAQSKIKQERENQTLTKIAIAACDTAGVKELSSNQLTATHQQLQVALDGRKQDFAEWNDRFCGTRKSLKHEFVKHWQEKSGRRLDVREWYKIVASGMFLKFVETELPRRPPESRFFLDEPFVVLRHVALPEGFRVECVFEEIPGGGSAKFLASDHAQAIPLEKALLLDNTPESYWEAHILLFEESQFFLYWHSNYGKRFLVYNLRGFLSNYRFGRDETGGIVFDRLTEEEQHRLLKMDFSPVLTTRADGTDILCTTFSPFGGFVRHHYSLAYQSPGIAISSVALEKINYNCGIVF